MPDTSVYCTGCLRIPVAARVMWSPASYEPKTTLREDTGRLLHPDVKALPLSAEHGTTSMPAESHVQVIERFALPVTSDSGRPSARVGGGLGDRLGLIQAVTAGGW